MARQKLRWALIFSQYLLCASFAALYYRAKHGLPAVSERGKKRQSRQPASAEENIYQDNNLENSAGSINNKRTLARNVWRFKIDQAASPRLLRCRASAATSSRLASGDAGLRTNASRRVCCWRLLVWAYL